MALSPDQIVAVLNRIKSARQKAINKRQEFVNNGKPDSVYRAEIERKIIEYGESIERLLGKPTLDFARTMKDVEDDLKVWEDALKSL